MESPDDLNARADAVAAIYDQVCLLTAEDLDLANVADGGGPQSVSYTAGGAAGPASEHVGVDGICWSGVNSFALTEQATHVGLLVGGVLFRTELLPSPVGPGSVPFVHRVGPAA